ncbi:MAG TPA: DUF2188 domain-containing protein [Thermoanaerobaculia bacterium]|jgi:hypothetical protein|nr:DUF2188 domain-containing protein [Thermoanaerobaculia bacterium]
MAEISYRIVEHDGGWAYKLGDVFSETFPSHDAARRAAEQAAGEQRVPGKTEGIVYEDDRGVWRSELADGADRPDPRVVD